MKRYLWQVVMGAGVLLGIGVWAAEPGLTIYNQNFGVVRENVPLDLKQGINEVAFDGATTQVEPDSVVLRDPAGKRSIRVLEQNYRGDPLSQELLLAKFEGQTIDFFIQEGNVTRVAQGKIIRAGLQVPGQQPYGGQQPISPIIEMEGKLRFSLPGQPLFPSLGDGTVLKPTLTWQLDSAEAGPLKAELSYVTWGLAWTASYNLVAKGDGDKIDLVGWVTMYNYTGKSFENARIKLAAGNINKQDPALLGQRTRLLVANSFAGPAKGGYEPMIQEKAFDEYHLYTLERPATLLDRQTKQVEFIRVEGVQSERYYVYDGIILNPDAYRSWGIEQLMKLDEFGCQSKTTVGVMRAFKNTKENKLGIPLPAGKTRFYRRDEDGQLEFTGENSIKHTPSNETIKVYTGDSFDLVGERKRMIFKVDHQARTTDESFEITLRNHKKEPVEIRVTEHLGRGVSWEVREPSDPFNKIEAQTIEFRVQVKPEEDKVIKYSVHYTW